MEIKAEEVTQYQLTARVRVGDGDWQEIRRVFTVASKEISQALSEAGRVMSGVLRSLGDKTDLLIGQSKVELHPTIPEPRKFRMEKSYLRHDPTKSHRRIR